jgi:CHAT domain
MRTPVEPDRKSPKTILFLAANPKQTHQLRLDEEAREVRRAIERSSQRDNFWIEDRWAVTSGDVRRALLDCQPTVVHFSGHGQLASATTTQSEGLVFENETGYAQVVSADAIGNLFELFADTVECVVLNACYSATQAEAIGKHIPYVVGMQREIGDVAAIEFSTGFYDGLLAGRTVEFAYRMGCNAIQMQGIREHLTPVLMQRVGEEPSNPQKTIPSQQTPAVDRLQLIRTLNALPAPQFEELLFVLNPPSGNVPGTSASQASRSADLIRWVESPIGPGGVELEAMLERIMTG